MVAWLTISLIVAIVFGIILKVCENETLAVISFILCVTGGLSLLIGFCVVLVQEDKPEERYERLLRNLDNANKELQKFYIDHPEFKEE